MARPRLLDLMQVYPFWVFDASGLAGNAIFSIFDPVFGFSSVTAPEISVEMREVQPGNWEYKHRAVKTADVGPITMSRGARFYDSDFYNWITNAIRGIQPVRRNLVLVHFMGWKPSAQAQAADGSNSVRRGLTEVEDNAQLSLGFRVPGRAWVLFDCVPQRYKAGSDFDASSSDVSETELEVQPEYIHEATIATLSPATARLFSSGVEVVSAL